MTLGLFIKRRGVWMPCALLTAMVLIFVLWPEPEPVAPKLPSPNGYDDFVKAGSLIAESGIDYPKAPMEELRTCLSTNQEPLRLVRLGIARECLKPIEYSKKYYQDHWGELSDVKRLALLVSAEGRLAELEGRRADAARSHSINLLLGDLSANGGLIVEKLTGIAIEAVGMVGLERIAGTLTIAEALEVIATLETIDSRSTRPEVYIARNRKWSRRVASLTDHIQMMWEFQTLFPGRISRQGFIWKVHNTDLRRRQLLLTLATRACELEHGKRPSRAEDLVPSVLRAIPKDPDTGTNLVLQINP